MSSHECTTPTDQEEKKSGDTSTLFELVARSDR